MNDVETELRRYGRHVLDRTRPVELGEVLGETPAPTRDGATATPRSRPWLLPVAAALVAVVVAGVAMLDRRPSTDDPVVPATEPDSLVDLPLPSTTVPTVTGSLDLVETPIGTIEWTVVEGGPDDVPSRIVDGSTATNLRGTARDGSPMLSTDGGRTWERANELAPVSRSVGGYDWTNVDGRLARIADDGTAVPVAVPSPVAAPEAPWEIWTNVEPEFPVELDGNAYIFATTGVGLDFGPLITDPDVDGIRLIVGSEAGGRTVILSGAEDTSEPVGNQTVRVDLELRVIERPDSRRLDFVDPDDVTVASIDADVDGFDEYPPNEMVFGAALVQLLRFDGTDFVPVDTPLPRSGRVQIADLGGSVLVLHETGPPWNPDVPTLWRTDGTTWTHREPLPGHDTTSSTTDTGGPHQNRATLTATNEGAVLTTYRDDDIRHDLTTDGDDFRQIHLPSNSSGREQLGTGWAAFVNAGVPAIHFSSDGSEWERVSLTSYYDIGRSNGSYGQLFIVDSTIYVVIEANNENNDNLALLIGHLDDPSSR